MALAQLLPMLTLGFDPRNTTEANKASLCSPANLHPKSMRTEVCRCY